MSYSLLIVGAGQLGSRYLQGLVRSESALRITVVDLSSERLKTAKLRWIEAGGEKSAHEVRWLESIPLDLQRVDLTLVVTSSKGRANLIERIAKTIEVRYWVLEKVLTQSSDELRAIQSVLAGCEKAWVNTPRRMMNWYRSLKEALASFGPLKVLYSEGFRGLACNSIHFIDLVAWWSGEKLVNIDTNGLDQYWRESKRLGYFEITGELVAHYSRGTSLRLGSKDGSEESPIRVELCNGIVWKIDERAGVALSSHGERIDGCLEFQSQISGQLVDRILQSGQSALPSFDESSAMHAVFLDAMLAHWNLSQKRNDVCVPIT